MFKVSDLKTGMKVVVEDRQGERKESIVLRDIDCSYIGEIADVLVCPQRASHIWYKLRSFDNDKMCDAFGDKIIKVYRPHHPYSVFYRFGLIDESRPEWELLWERDNRREMTLEEVENMLGYRVKIVEREDE